MPKNAIKREGRVNFWKNIDWKKPETRPEPVMSNPNPTRTRRNISKPDPTRTRKKFQNPNPTRTRHLATRPITSLAIVLGLQHIIPEHVLTDMKSPKGLGIEISF